MSRGWTVERSTSTAGEFHARPVPDPAEPAIWIHEVTGPALVLGSTQSDDVVDRDAVGRLGVEVVRRRSGGGAVYLDVGAQTWVDVIIPRGGVGWHDDVHRPMVWFGDVLAAAFAEQGVAVSVHDGPMRRSEWSDLVCFDGLAPGESKIEGAKLVGISQRRTRAAARLQCCWYHRYDPTDLVTLLVDGPAVDMLTPVATVDAEVSGPVVGGLLRLLGSVH
ncbi:MAG: hypothetical protein AAGD33_03265 [Actinomycetota bacterium]